MRYEPNLRIIKDSYLDTRKVVFDKRGYFSEIDKGGLFVANNASMSKQNVLRGMHIQINNPQGKLVTCLYGEIVDVAIDLRRESPTFLMVEHHILSAKNAKQFWIPPGCAHGFYVRSNRAVVQYSCSTPYDMRSDSGISWRSRGILDVFSQYCSEPIMSEKDAKLPELDEWLEKNEVRDAYRIATRPDT